jgi:hypothetical protein
MKYSFFLASFLMVIAMTGCKKTNENSSAPTLTLTAINNVSRDSAVGAGKIISTAKDSLMAVGLCWALTPSPTTDGPTQITYTFSYNYDLSLPFEFRAQMNGGKYYVRAFAANKMGKIFYSNELTFTSKSFALGDTLKEGIIFSIFPGGDGGIIAAFNDLTTACCINVKYNETDATSSSDGTSNTGTIIVNQPTPGDFAAFNAQNYKYNQLLGRHDWFLPAIDQLNLLYSKKDLVGGFSNVPYWSSTEVDSTKASYVDFSNGQQKTGDKANIYAVRPIRFF